MSLLKYCGALLISFYALSANAEYKYFENQEEVDKVLKEVKCSDEKDVYEWAIDLFIHYIYIY